MATIIGHALTIDDSGNVSTPGNLDTRDVSADGSKLDGIPADAEANTVDSVNSETGAVVLSAADVGADTAGTAASAVSTHESSFTHANIPSTAAAAAISGAASPSGANVFATMDDLDGVGASEAEVKVVSAATYTLLDDDSMKWLRFTNAGGCVITIPATWPADAECICEGTQDALDFTGTAVSAATLEAYGSHSASEGAGAVCGLKCTSNSGGSSAVVTLFGRTSL